MKNIVHVLPNTAALLCCLPNIREKPFSQQSMCIIYVYYLEWLLYKFVSCFWILDTPTHHTSLLWWDPHSVSWGGRQASGDQISGPGISMHQFLIHLLPLFHWLEPAFNKMKIINVFNRDFIFLKYSCFYHIYAS